MTTRTLIDILKNRKSITSNPTEAQLLGEVIDALIKLEAFELPYERRKNKSETQK